MSVPRRGFLKTGVLAAVASGLPPSIRRLAFTRAPSSWDPLLKLGFADFSSCLGDWFEIDRGIGASDRIRLVKIVDLRSEPAKNDPALAGKDCFSLVFSAANGRAAAFGSSLRRVALLPEDRHRFRHDRLGEFQLLVSPAGNDANGPLHIAVINRLHP